MDEPERVFRAWLEQAVLIAGGVLPNRAVRFVVAPRRTPMLGVWVPSQDALGRSFPLVFLRRLSSSLEPDRAAGSFVPHALADLPWTLLLAGCSHYLAAAESCLMLGRATSAASVFAKLEALPLPSQRDLLGLCAEANRVLESEQLDAFAARNLGSGATDPEFLNALRRLGPRVAESRHGDSMLALPAAHEFDVFAWLELLRAQRPAEATPRSLFWSPADRRALVSLGAPLPGTLAFLRQHTVRSVQRLPVVHEPDESPAIENELCRLVRRCPTLAKLRAALSGDAKEAGRPPPLPKKEEHPAVSPAPESKPISAAPQPPDEHHSDSEPPPLQKFASVEAPRSHFPWSDYPTEAAQRPDPEQPRDPYLTPRPADAPRTEPLSGCFAPQSTPLGRIHFRVPDPPLNLSDTDAIEYVCAWVKERERADDEPHQRREHHDASRADRAHMDALLEQLARRERTFLEREEALAERERSLRQRELALEARERHLRDRERALGHDARARRISQTVPIPSRSREPPTVVDDGSIRAARVLMLD